MQITKPRTQRKKLFQAPAHRRHRHFSAPLSPDLKKKHGANAFPVRMGDTVRLMRGDRKGFEGKIIRVDYDKYRVFVEGVTREKVDGTAIPIPIHPSKIIIINLSLDDKLRREALKRKKPSLEAKTQPQIVEAPSEKKRKSRRKKREKEPEKPVPKKGRKTRKTRSQGERKLKKSRTKKES